MSLLSVTEHSDLSKTRRSLYVASLYTFIVANADIAGDYLVIFQLKVRFVQTDLIALGRFTVAALLWIFLLHTMTEVFSKASGLAKNWYDRWERAAQNEIYEMENRSYYNEEPEKLEIFFGSEREKKSRLVHYFVRSEILFDALKAGFLKYVFVILLSICALFWPQSANTILDLFRLSYDTSVSTSEALGEKPPAELGEPEEARHP